MPHRPKNFKIRGPIWTWDGSLTSTTFVWHIFDPGGCGIFALGTVLYLVLAIWGLDFNTWNLIWGVKNDIHGFKPIVKWPWQLEYIIIHMHIKFKDHRYSGLGSIDWSWPVGQGQRLGEWKVGSSEGSEIHNQGQFLACYSYGRVTLGLECVWIGTWMFRKLNFFKISSRGPTPRGPIGCSPPLREVAPQVFLCVKGWRLLHGFHWLEFWSNILQKGGIGLLKVSENHGKSLVGLGIM